MKLWGIFRFELAYQLRRFWIWLIFGALFVLAFLMTRDVLVADAMYEDYFANGTFAIALTTVIVGIFWLLAAPVVAGEAAARDVKTGMYPLTWTAPIGKSEYLGGRLLAALALNALLLLAVQAGALLAVYVPGGNPRMIGPFRPAAYLTAYAIIGLANAFVATAIQFFLALRSGRAMAGYLGSLFLIFMGVFVATFVHWFVKQGMGALLDPIGIHFIVEDLAHQWTPIERNTRLLRLEGFILTNRLIWTGVGLGTLALTWLSFRFAHRGGGDGWWKRWRRRRSVNSPTPAGIGVTARAPVSVPGVRRRFGFAIQARKALAIAGISFRALAKSWAGLVLLVVVPLMSIVIVLDQASALGVPLVPATALVLRELTGGLSADLASEPNRWVILPLFIVFFAGELVWRERDAEIAEITDATPGSEWAPLVGKFLGLALVLALFMAALTGAGMLAQTIAEYREFEIGLYAKILFGLQLPEYLLFAALAMMVHVLVNQKYVAHLMAVLAYAFIAFLAKAVGIEHNLLVYADGPGWFYTDIRGFGASIAPWLWFKLYWATWAMLLAVGATLLWVRGKEEGLGARLRIARQRFTGSTAGVAAGAAALVLTLGGFAFYNTNVRNEYFSTEDVEELSAGYERLYRRYEGLPQPRLAKVDLRIDIHPDQGAAEIRGSYRLVNAGGAPIESIHVSTGGGRVETRTLTLDRPAMLAVDDEVHSYRIYDLERPLAP
ncbi:MAG TPA: ABC transporter permease, partial [Gemmatimonadota bacterium]|nr:ABC transporter permease [Gemmatimonadota bacterium]